MILPNGPALCDLSGASYLIFSDHVPALVKYSHFSVLCVTLIVAVFVFLANRKALANKVLFFTLASFFVWVFLDSIFWAANSSDKIMFVWTLQIIFEPLIYLGSFYLFYVLTSGQDVAANKKILFLIPYFVILIFSSTKYNLPGFDIASCLSEEGPMAIYYTYSLEIFYTICLFAYTWRQFRATVDKKKRSEIKSLAIGILFFLLAFSWGNIISSFTENWNYAQVGLFAMPVFIAFLAYSVVKFQTFQMKVIGASFLVSALILLIASLFFTVTDRTSVIIISASFLLTIIFGAFLVRSVKQEVSQREQLAQANAQLKALDERKTEFLDIASHQLRTPLSAIIGLLSMQYDGDFDNLPKAEVKEQQKNMLICSERLKNIVHDLMDAMEVELGAKLKLEPTDCTQLVQEAINTMHPDYEKKNLYIKFTPPEKKLPLVDADPSFLSQVFINLVDNACHYTATGGAEAKIYQKDNQIVFEITDTGMGVTAEEKDELFSKFTRAKRAVQLRPDGSGLGLFIVKKIVEVHGGEVILTSAGENKGTTFQVTLPIKM